MDFRLLRTGVNAAAVTVALLVALCIPLGFLWVSCDKEIAQLEFRTKLSAARLARYIYANEPMWQYRKNHLAGIIDFDNSSMHQRVTDASGREVLTVGVPPAAPLLQRSAPIVIAGRTIGTLEASVSLQPLLWWLAGVSIFSAILGFAAFVAVRLLPLRALDRTLGELESSNSELLRSNRELTAQAEKLAEAQRLGKIGYWHIELETREVWWSAEVFELLGYRQDGLIPETDVILGLMGPGDAQALLDSQKRAVRDHTIETLDVKIRRGNGSPGFFSIVTRAVLDEQGHLTGLSGTVQDITARKNAEDQLEKLAYFDALTGLANRALFIRRLEVTLKEPQDASGRVPALLLVDLDKFKEVNDTLGHNAGDQLLVEVVRRIQSVLRREDFFARLGGDEFAVVVRSDSLDAVREVADQILSSLAGTITLERGVVTAGASIGVALLGKDGATPSEVLRNADLALYRAKDSGRGNVKFFEPGMNADVQNKVALARDLRRSIEEGTGLALHYQPLIDLRRGNVTGYEALLRWNHPERGNVSPAEFIPIAESSRLICELGSWVLRTAIHQAKAWIDAGEPPREVAVNVSAAQIWHSNVLEDVDRYLGETGLAPHLLCVELTESLMAERGDARVAAVLHGLRKRGITLALDDFGTGYSSLGYLSELPFDKLKIDRVFLVKAGESEHARELLKGIVALGHGLGLKVQAEGAETMDEVRMLTAFDVDSVQGFAFSKAVPPQAASAFARDYDTNSSIAALRSIVELAGARQTLPRLGAAAGG